MTTWGIFSWVGVVLFLKWLHVAVGTLWIGSSFVLPEESFQTKKSKVVFLSAHLTLLTGLLHVVGNYNLSFYSAWGISMLLGSALGCLMWLILMFGVNPALKARNQGNFRRWHFTNVLLSIPMLFFMEAASHIFIDVHADSNPLILTGSLALPILLVCLYSGIGKGPQINSLKRAVPLGLVLMILLYVIFELTSKSSI